MSTFASFKDVKKKKSKFYIICENDIEVVYFKSEHAKLNEPPTICYCINFNQLLYRI